MQAKVAVHAISKSLVRSSLEKDMSSTTSSSGHSPIPIPPPHSNMSTSSIDSGIFSSVSSPEHRNLTRDNSHTEETAEVIFTCSLSPSVETNDHFTLSPLSSAGINSVTTPQHSTSEIKSLRRLPSTARYQAVFPQPLHQGQQATLHTRSRSWSKKTPNLPTLPESGSLGNEFENLNRKVEETMRKIRSHSLSSLSGEQSPSPQRTPLERRKSKMHKRNRSDGDSLSSLIGSQTPPVGKPNIEPTKMNTTITHKRTHSDGNAQSSLTFGQSTSHTPPIDKTKTESTGVRKRTTSHKRTYSEGSITINLHFQTVYYVHRPPLSTDEENDEKTERQASHENTTSANEENDWVFVQEDLTKKELLLIANDINPDKGRSLSSILHNGTHVWTELGHLHPPLSPRDRIFSVLERWFENVSEGPENRRTLANACKSVEQIRIANRIARKLYVTS